MKDIFFLTTSAAWRKLYHIRTKTYTAQNKSQNKTQNNIVHYLSLAPYATESGRQQLAEIAAEDKIAACGLALYRTSLLLSYKHIINKDFLQAHEECSHAVNYLLESLNRLAITTDMGKNELEARARCFVNCLASQADLQEARRENKIASHLVFILGMHRSGTSALTGMLAKAGFAVPSDLMPATNANPKGYWESVGIMRVNENFLAGMESHWTSSLQLPAGWSQSINSRIWRASLLSIICDSFGGAELPVIKDPRFCTLVTGLEPWLESGLIESTILMPIRHPLEVANSLREAERIDLNKALRLWIKSIFTTEEATRGYKRKFIIFDELIQKPINVLETCLQLVDNTADGETTWSRAECECVGPQDALSQATAFIDKRLKRQRAVVSTKNTMQANTTQTQRLISIAETLFQAIITNIMSDEDISCALDKLRPTSNLCQPFRNPSTSAMLAGVDAQRAQVDSRKSRRIKREVATDLIEQRGD